MFYTDFDNDIGYGKLGNIATFQKLHKDKNTNEKEYREYLKSENPEKYEEYLKWEKENYDELINIV